MIFMFATLSFAKHLFMFEHTSLSLGQVASWMIAFYGAEELEVTSVISHGTENQSEQREKIFGCFRKLWYPQIINFNRDFHYKPSILGYHYFWKNSFR